MNYGQIIHRTADDSYVITKNGMPYHVYPYAAEFAEEWDAVFTYAEAHPECVTEKHAGRYQTGQEIPDRRGNLRRHPRWI